MLAVHCAFDEQFRKASVTALHLVIEQTGDVSACTKRCVFGQAAAAREPSPPTTTGVSISSGRSRAVACSAKPDELATAPGSSAMGPAALLASANYKVRLTGGCHSTGLLALVQSLATRFNARILLAPF